VVESGVKDSLLRRRDGHGHAPVTMIELFFDLVFVFAVTQLSHRLLADLSPIGAVQTLLLFLAVWWLWIYTSWMTNWLDPQRLPVRVLLLMLMLGGLLLSSSIPAAFGERGALFAFVFASIQIGRSLFMLAALRGHQPTNFRNFVRITIWFLVSGAFWIAGALNAEDRLALWGLAIALELLGPSAYFWVPGLGRSSTAEWDIDGAHLAERCALFVIIALGESILVTGATFAELEWNTTIVAAFLIAFLGSVAMWWVYFDTGAERASARIVKSADPGRHGRLAYTYLHALIIAGIIVCAVADEIVLVHPGHLEAPGIAAILGGPIIYLTGNALFKWTMNDRRLPPLSHLAGLATLCALIPPALGHQFSALVLGGLTTLVMIVVATWESISLRR